MSIPRLAARPDGLDQLARTRTLPTQARAVSRYVFVRRAAVAAGAAVTSGLWAPALARAGGPNTTSAAPRPIPANPGLFGLHIQFPVEGADVSSIFDFNGEVGATELRGAGTATFADGSTRRLFFDV